MFTSNQMQQIEKASAALTSSGDSVMTRVELQQLYDEVFPRNFLRAMSVPL
jgi:Ca2+-binding EF-hand superfamily protein